MVSNDYQLKRNVCDSLLLNFDKPLDVGDKEVAIFTIPSSGDCESIFIRATEELCGRKLGRSIYFYDYISPLEKSKKLNPRIVDALYHSFTGHRDEDNFFGLYLASEGFFDSEFFYGFGTLYRYYPKAKEEALKNIESFFNKQEKESLDEFGILVKKHRDILWKGRLKMNKKSSGLNLEDSCGV